MLWYQQILRGRENFICKADTPEGQPPINAGAYVAVHNNARIEEKKQGGSLEEIEGAGDWPFHAYTTVQYSSAAPSAADIRGQSVTYSLYRTLCGTFSQCGSECSRCDKSTVDDLSTSADHIRLSDWQNFENVR